jgi:hypothetical protein
MGHESTLDTTHLFNTLDITRQAVLESVDLYTFNSSGTPVKLRKFQQRDHYRRNPMVMNVSLSIRRGRLVGGRCMVFYFMPSDSFSSMTMTIDTHGSVWVRAIPVASSVMSKIEFMSVIEPTVNIMLEWINAQSVVFTSQRRLPALGSPLYQVAQSSAVLAFKFPLIYTKLLDIIVEILMHAGMVSPADGSVDHYSASFVIQYGINDHRANPPVINVRNVHGAASIELIDLDIGETAFYIDVIGRVLGRQHRLESPLTQPVVADGGFSSIE